ncbi:probable calcium-binding protein CML15 [Typha angustifolia]|uniref:probable calcium-binding protein CML15 n=1 Tax=Typha angustifolia TaxID=59011 RepID=UPI003C2FCBCD
MGKIRSLFRRRSQSKPSPTSSPPPETVVSSQDSEEEMERVFNKFDSNGDGRISRSELSAIFESLGKPATEEEVERMMREADADGDGFISLEEFADLNAGAAGEKDLRDAFSVFDLDRNGSISADELARVLRGLGEGASVAQCRRMIDGVDRDGDGLVSFEEFKVMMANGSSSVFALAKIG